MLPVFLPYLHGNGNQTQATPTPSSQTLRDFVLPAIDGSTVQLSERAALHSAIVLVFYRGSSCQGCQAQLAEYQSGYQAIQNAGGEVIAVDLQGEADAQAMATDLGVRYPMLYDGSTMATIYGLAEYLATDYTTATMLVDSRLNLIGNPIGTQAEEVLPAAVVAHAIQQATGTGTSS